MAMDLTFIQFDEQFVKVGHFSMWHQKLLRGDLSMTIISHSESI